MLAALRTKPFRGDQVAAGAVVLTVLVALLNVRFAGDWSSGVHLLYSAAAALFVLGLAAATAHEAGGPPAWHSALYVTGFLLAVAALIRLADVLGGGGAGTVTWVGAVLTVLGAWMARDRGSASGTLLAALSAVVTSLAALSWVFSPDRLRDYRYLLLVDILVLALAALWQRVRAPAHGVQLLNAAGLVLVLIGVTFAVEAVRSVIGTDVFNQLLGSTDPRATAYDGVPWGWAALTLAGGIGILSAGAADGERGNVTVGVLVLLVFVAMASGGNLLGWPLLLGAAAAALLIVGLRPSTPLPAEPPEGAGSSAPPSPPSIRPVS